MSESTAKTTTTSQQTELVRCSMCSQRIYQLVKEPCELYREDLLLESVRQIHHTERWDGDR